MKPIPSHPGYLINELGEVFSTKSKKILGQWNTNGYAMVDLYEKGTKKRCSIHRLLALTYFGPSEGKEVDHKDGNRANNSLSNLRYATRCENMANSKQHGKNTSGHRGVYFDAKVRRWASSITWQKTRKWLGYFDRIEEAVSAYKNAAWELHGQFSSPAA